MSNTAEASGYIFAWSSKPIDIAAFGLRVLGPELIQGADASTGYVEMPEALRALVDEAVAKETLPALAPGTRWMVRQDVAMTLILREVESMGLRRDLLVMQDLTPEVDHAGE